MSSLVTLRSMGAVTSAVRKYEANDSAVAALDEAALARLNRWLAASADAKFMRASIPPVENQAAPVSQPATSGGSYNVCPMLARGASASLTEKPVQPMSFSARATNSTGHP